MNAINERLDKQTTLLNECITQVITKTHPFKLFGRQEVQDVIVGCHDKMKKEGVSWADPPVF